MPMKPKRPCSYPGCPRLTDGRFCEEHERKENKRYEKYDRDPAVRRERLKGSLAPELLCDLVWETMIDAARHHKPLDETLFALLRIALYR